LGRCGKRVDNERIAWTTGPPGTGGTPCSPRTPASARPPDRRPGNSGAVHRDVIPRPPGTKWRARPIEMVCRGDYRKVLILARSVAREPSSTYRVWKLVASRAFTSRAVISWSRRSLPLRRSPSRRSTFVCIEVGIVRIGVGSFVMVAVVTGTSKRCGFRCGAVVEPLLGDGLSMS
jgi:hypothetical protein